jgi:hypothetical protein
LEGTNPPTKSPFNKERDIEFVKNTQFQREASKTFSPGQEYPLCRGATEKADTTE